MLLRITHETELTYSSPISESMMELRMCPRQGQDQHLLSFKLAVGPAAPITRYFDWLGNMVHTFGISPFHDCIRIVATSVVETLHGDLEVNALPDRWPLDDTGYANRDFLLLEGPVVDCARLRALAVALEAKSGEPLGDIATRLLGLLGSRFEYERGVTSAASPITDILEKQRGVCQDFTHLMIGVARVLGIPARYVSGCLHPLGDKARGFTETHAWCELFFPSSGWVGFDAANGCLAGANFVKLAVGRSFTDVPPNKGVFRGKASEAIQVRVQSEELAGVPPGLAPERFEALPVKIAGLPRAPHVDQIAQQQEQQQQEQQQQ
jgi:transglutaminase-like putative cysteine protease